jgi:nitroreductase/dihydropteridine reductase
MNTIENALNWRYATKKFDETKKLTSEQIDMLVNSARMAPSSFGLQPFRLLVIEDQNIRQQLKIASWNQEQITSASHLFVFTAIKDLSDKHVEDFIQLTAQERGLEESALADYKSMISGSVNSMSAEQKLAWAQKQAYLAMGVVIMTGAMAEIDSCPMEGFDKAEYDRILGLADKNLTATVILPVGFRADDDNYASLKKVRLPVSQFVV